MPYRKEKKKKKEYKDQMAPVGEKKCRGTTIFWLLFYTQIVRSPS